MHSGLLKNLFYCSLLPLIQTNNSSLNPTQETGKQTGVLYKAMSFSKKTSQEWPYKYFHGTLLLFEIHVWRNNSRTRHESVHIPDFLCGSKETVLISKSLCYYFCTSDECRLPKNRLKAVGRKESTLHLWFCYFKTMTDNYQCTSLHVHRFFLFFESSKRSPPPNFQCASDLLAFLCKSRNTSIATPTLPQIFNLKWRTLKTKEKAGCLDLQWWNNVFLGNSWPFCRLVVSN